MRSGLRRVFWRGDSRLLTVMAYATPLCSALLLVALGLESLTLGLGIGAVLIVLAGCAGRALSGRRAAACGLIRPHFIAVAADLRQLIERQG